MTSCTRLDNLSKLMYCVITRYKTLVVHYFWLRSHPRCHRCWEIITLFVIMQCLLIRWSWVVRTYMCFMDGQDSCVKEAMVITNVNAANNPLLDFQGKRRSRKGRERTASVSLLLNLRIRRLSVHLADPLRYPVC